MATIPEALAIALEHHRAGRLAEAEHIYRQILAVEPDQADAFHLLGRLAHEAGKHAVAVEYMERAVRLNGDVAEFHNSLGEAYRTVRRMPDAAAAYRRAVALKPGFAEAHNNLGNVLKDQEQPDEALACYRRALQLQPALAQAQYNVGVVLAEQGKLDEAVVCYRRAVELKPDYAKAHNNLGAALKELGKLDEAVVCYRRAVELKPDYAQAHNNLGAALQDQGKLDEAVVCYRRALELEPDFAEAHNNLGADLTEQGRLEEALAFCRRALELRADYAEAHCNLGNALKDQGKLDEALASYRRALELKPDFAGVHSNLVYTQMFCSGRDVRALAAEHRRWNQQHAAPLAKFIQPHRNDRCPDRRLRVGYVSPDFRSHPVGRFVLPLLGAHDHGGFEIVCYASVRAPDALTHQCRAQADGWRDVLGMSDQRVADGIRRDQIDILVDLTMHMAENRLLVFARKPAPVQVTYLAYCGTTGLSTMDYRLTDPYLDPPGGETGAAQEDEPFYCEQSVRLPETYWCYRPANEAPPVTALPAPAAGHVTFACLNNFCKVTAPVLAAWRRLLQAVPGSRLLLHAHPGRHRETTRALLAQQGISAQRLAFVGLLPMADYLALYQQLDVALDPFPYNGGTTTCDALWMGVPVVSLRGELAVGRGGLSILSNIGLPELVAGDADEYVRIAAGLANDLPRLQGLRSTMRQRMLTSPLLDAPRFARGVEAAYRQMWRRWCGGEERMKDEACPEVHGTVLAQDLSAASSANYNGQWPESGA